MEINKYLQRIIHTVSELPNQRSMLYLAIAGVSVCLILIVLGFIFPTGITTDNKSIQDNPNRIVKTESGITSKYTAQEAIDFVKDGFKAESLDIPDCNPEQAKWKAFFSHRKYWTIAVLCPPDIAKDIHVWTEYTYEFNEWDETVKTTTQQ